MNWQLLNADGLPVVYNSTAAQTVYAPTNAPYLTVTPDANLSAEFALSTLAAGLLYNNPGGNPSIATLAQRHWPIVVLGDVYAAGTAGGTFTAGAWQKRLLSTLYNPDSLVLSVINNEFLLIAGTYRVTGYASAYQVQRHQARLYNVTDAVVQASLYGNNVVGSSEANGTAGGTSTHSLIDQYFTIAANKTMRLEHRCSTTRATDGFGLAANFGEIETYALLHLTKVA